MSSTAVGFDQNQNRRGESKNRDLIRNFLIEAVAADTKIEQGAVCYRDGLNGWKPTDGVKAGAACRVAINEADNTGGDLGDLFVSLYGGSGAIAVLEASGVIAPDARVSSAADGKGAAIANVAAVADIVNTLGINIGKVNEVDELDKALAANRGNVSAYLRSPTAAGDMIYVAIS